MPYAKRIYKKRAGKLLDKILKTGYFVACNYHPIRLTEYSWGGWDHDVSGIALTNEGFASCCLCNCQPEPITKIQAEEMVDIWKKSGDRGLAIHFGGYTEEQYSEFEKMWR